jgi:hypothetical protein
MFKKVARDVLWFVPLWLAGAMFMIVPGWAMVVVMPIAAILAITPFRAGRLSGLQVVALGGGGLFFGAGLGLATKLVLRN